MIESKFKSWDGTELFYRAWPAEGSSGRAILLFHRGHEHSERWIETVEALGLDDVSFFAWDQRGHGNSPGERGAAESLAAVVRDADSFAGLICREYSLQIENVAVIAHSVGAVVAATWVHDYAPRIRALILGAPAFKVKLYVPLAIPFLRLKNWLFGNGYVKSYVKSNVLTHDPEQARKYSADRRIFRQIAVNILLDLFDTSERVVSDAGAIVVPTLVLAAGSDWVVHISAQRKFYDNLSSRIKRFEILPGFYHAIFHEKDRKLLTDKIRDFTLEQFNAPVERSFLLDADKEGFTYDQYRKFLEPAGLQWRLTKFMMKTFCSLSKGISIGWKHGFDSGITLDYVYTNKPEGVTPLGKFIDMQYLNSPGWSGIRIRRENMEKILGETVDSLLSQGRQVRILDIAAGAGRYVLSTLAARKGAGITAVLRDYRAENLDAGRKIAQGLGLSNVGFVQGDAFDRASLAAVDPKPNIAIVSGLYELFPQNAPLRESLAGLAACVEPGGYLIYTCQPWHPQAEFIARVLDNREGRPWVMRCRTQAEMDELVRNAGFEKVREEIDQWGIFSVSLARRA